MKSWIHEISESYVGTHKPIRRDLKENYASLTEEQQFGLFSQNVLSYLDEQLQNAFGFGVGDLSEEQLNTLFANLLEYNGPMVRALIMGKDGLPNIEAAKTRKRRIDSIPDIVDSEKGTKRTAGKRGHLIRMNKSFDRFQAASDADDEIIKELGSR